MRKNKNFIRQLLQEGETLFNEGRSTTNDTSCQKEFDGLIKIEYAKNADDPEYKSTEDEKRSSRILWRSRDRKGFFNACAVQGSGQRLAVVQSPIRPIPLPEPAEPEARTMDERAERLSRNLDGVDNEIILKLRAKLIEETLSKDIRRFDCRETLAFFLDANAMGGKQYGLSIEEGDVEAIRHLKATKSKILRRCLRVFPRTVEVAPGGGPVPSEAEARFRLVELDGVVKKRRSLKKNKRK